MKTGRPSRTGSVANRRIVERNAHDAPMVPVVLPDDALTIELPQPRAMVRARGNQIRRIGAESAVPNPALVAMESGLEGESIGVTVSGQHVLGRGIVRLRGVDGPDAGRVVGGASGEMAHVGGEQHAGDVGVVGDEFAHGDERGLL